MTFLSGIISKITTDTIGTVVDKMGSGLGSVLNRCGLTEKMSEIEKINKYVEVMHIDEKSTDSARKMFMVEMKTQRQPWIIRLLNGFIRPFGGIMCLIVEFYVIVGENISSWFDITYMPITLSLEQHGFMLTIVCFYYGSRSREIIKGVTTQR